MSTSTQTFFRDSRVRRTPAPVRFGDQDGTVVVATATPTLAVDAVLASAIAATLDDALHRAMVEALIDLGEDEDALRRELEGDDRLDDIGRRAAAPDDDDADADDADDAADADADDDADDDLEDTQPMVNMRSNSDVAAFEAPIALQINGSPAALATASGGEVLDQDLRAEHHQDEPACEFEFFARFST